MINNQCVLREQDTDGGGWLIFYTEEGGAYIVFIIYIYININILIYIYIYVNMYIYRYIYINMYMYIHIYMNIN